MSTHRSYNPFSAANKIGTDFMAQYPEILEKIGPITFFACFYYPIGNVELELLEHTTEEFDIIEKTILSLYNQGYTPLGMQDATGLPEKYIQQIISVLESYGHIDHQGITELGKQSLLEEVKLTLNTVRQKAQIDLYHNELLPKEMNVPPHQMLTKENTQFPVIHGFPEDTVKVDQLLQRIQERKQSYRKKGLLQVNVEGINRVIEKDIRFAAAFLVECNHNREPFVLLQCREYNKHQKPPTYSWKPIAVTERYQPFFDHNPFQINHTHLQALNRQKDEAIEKLPELVEKKWDKIGETATKKVGPSIG